MNQQTIQLDCPHCQTTIRKRLDWFRQTGKTCPQCQRDLSPEQFMPMISALEEAWDEHIDDMVTATGACHCPGKVCRGHDTK